MPKPPPPKRSRIRLTGRQRRFVREFLVDFDRKAASRRVGLTPSGGQHMFRSPKVLRALSLLCRWRIAAQGAGAFPLLPRSERGIPDVPSFPCLWAEPLMKPLTTRQLRFVEEFMVDNNARAAAQRAGYADSSTRKRPNVQAEIDRRMAERAQAMQLKADEILAGLIRIAFLRSRDLFDAEGDLLPMDRMPPEIADAFGLQLSVPPSRQAEGPRKDIVLRLDRHKALNDLAGYVGLGPQNFAAADAPQEKPLWTPLPGPQTLAYASDADILGYGGAAGGGKTDLACGLALTRHQVSHIFRREATQAAAIVERIAELTQTRKGYSAQHRNWRINGRRISFGSAPHPGDERRYQGRPKDLLVIDEAAHFLESQVRFLMGWVRSTTPGQRCRTVMTFNPPTTAQGRWVIDFFAPWLDPNHPNPAKDGELRWFATVAGKDIEVPDGRPFVLDQGTGSPRYLSDGENRGLAGVPVPGAANAKQQLIYPLSRTFIASRLSDNPHLADTGYMATLQAMPEPLRSQMLDGDFSAGVEDDRWQVIPTAWVDAAMARWTPGGRGEPMDSMGVDVARGGRDKTIIACRHGAWFDDLVCLDGPQTPDGPTLVGQVVTQRRDNAVVHIDVIGWGSSPYDFLQANGIQAVAFNGASRSSARTHDASIGFVNRRAEVWWRMREALDPNARPQLALPNDPALRADLCAPRWKQALSGIQIEAKDDVAARIGRSPDRGDAVCMGLMVTAKTVERREVRRRPSGGSWMG